MHMSLNSYIFAQYTAWRWPSTCLNMYLLNLNIYVYILNTVVLDAYTNGLIWFPIQQDAKYQRNLFYWLIDYLLSKFVGPLVGTSIPLIRYLIRLIYFYYISKWKKGEKWSVSIFNLCHYSKTQM